MPTLEPMYDNILFPTDGSEPADSVLDYAIRIAAHHDATLHVLNVAETTRDSLTRLRGEVVDVLEQERERIVADARRRRDTESGPPPAVSSS